MADHTKPRNTNNENPIAKARLAAGMTQQQLAELMGVTQKYIHRWENGDRRPRADSLVRLAIYLGVSPDDLYVE